MTLQEAVARNMRSHWDYAPEPEAVMRCPECGQYQGEGDVLYFYTGTGECVGCWRDVEKHSAEGFDYKCGMCGEETDGPIYTVRGTDFVLGCENCITERTVEECLFYGILQTA